MTRLMAAAALAAGLSLCVGGCDPELFLDTAGVHLVVGQKGRVKVMQGGDGSDLMLDSLSLTDSLGRSYDRTKLNATAVESGELELEVPTGIAPGSASLEVKTSAGHGFSGWLQITRLAAMRDLAGKVWMLALPDPGSMNQYLDIAPGTKGMGKGSGQVAISPDGKLLASSARSIWRVYFSWTGDHPMKHFVQLTREVIDLAVASTGQTLAATDQGIFYIQRPVSRDKELVLGKAALATGNTVCLAVARNAKAAAALSLVNSSSATYKLYRIGLSGADPKIETQDNLSWVITKDNVFDLAMTHDGQAVLATNKIANRLTLMKKSGARVGMTLPSGHSGPVSVVAGPGGMFYVLNETSKNVTVVTISGNKLKVQNKIDLGLAANSGAPLELSLSANDELVVLAQREVVLVDTKTALATTMKFTNLFADKTKGEIGASIAIQP